MGGDHKHEWGEDRLGWLVGFEGEGGLGKKKDSEDLVVKVVSEEDRFEGSDRDDILH